MVSALVSDRATWARHLNAGGYPAMDQHRIQMRVEILLVATEISSKQRPNGSLGFYADFIKCLYVEVKYK